jgi:hypothetical protein
MAFSGTAACESTHHLPILRAWRLRHPGRLVFTNEAGGMCGPSARIFQEVLHRVLAAAGFNDLHVSAGATGDRPGNPYPSTCQQGDLSKQEKVVEFMLFDLSSCVRNDDERPAPPPPPR